MRTIRLSGIFGGAVLTTLLASVPLPAAELTDATFARFRDLIRPSPQEFSWREEIPWQLTLGEGVAAAQQQDKPILLLTTAGQALGHC
jgi:hypothetical protein